MKILKLNACLKKNCIKFVSFTYEYLKNVYCQNIYSIIVLTKAFSELI